MKRVINHSDIFITVALISQDEGRKTLQLVRNVYQGLQGDYEYFEILIIDNWSDIHLVNEIKQLQKKIPGIRIISLSHRHDLQTVYLAALENSLGDYVVFMDIENDFSPVIREFVNICATGTDIVIANPKTKSNYSIIEKTVLMCIDAIFMRVLKVNFFPQANFIGIFSRNAVNSLVKIRNKKLHLRYSKAFIGLTKQYFDYTPVKVMSSKKRKLLIYPLLKLAVDILISNSQLPLRITTLLGILASFLSLLFVIYVFIITLIKNQIIEGWITTSLVTGGLFFLLFVILSVVSEYVGRILTELKDEPVYYIANEYHSSNNTNSKNRKRINVV